MTYRPGDRRYTAAEAYWAHYRKTALYGTEEAARKAARETEQRREWPEGAMSEYPCPVPECDGWHVGRTRKFVRWQRQDRMKYRVDLAMQQMIGDRALACGMRENWGPDGQRKAYIRRFGKTLNRLRKRAAKEAEDAGATTVG